VSVPFLAIHLFLHGLMIWGAAWFFRCEGRMPFGTKVIYASSMTALVAGAWAIAARSGGNVVQDTTAMVLAAICVSLFLWAVRTVGRKRLTGAFYPDQPTSIIATGPYCWIRNPFYLFNCLTHVFTLIASGCWWLAPLVPWMAGLYTAAALQEERRFLSGPLCEEYRQYLARTGRFFPRGHSLLRWGRTGAAARLWR
jgi:protein-S-isoprenylcysteine O-methyltransferase Ste14